MLRLVPGADLGAPALAALDRFLAEPRADTFVAAARTLKAACVEHATQHLRGFHDGRLFRRGLAAVRALPGVGAAHAQVLAELPADGRTGQRLLALAQLLEVHAELSGRTAAAFRELRRKLGPTTPAKPAAPTTWRTPVPGRRA